MSQLVSAMRAVATAALVGGYAWTCPATATADSNSAALAGMLSKGYSASNCKPDQVEGALAAYKCGQNTLPGGPVKAAYLLYGNPSDTAEGFKGLASDLTLAPCEPGASAPDSWHYQSSPDTPAGKVACGTSGDVAGVVWTNDQNHMAALVAGSDAKSLRQWWLANG
jgi:hypothetical protein